jgi:dTDP-4-dehydrorhamnose reductase
MLENVAAFRVDLSDERAARRLIAAAQPDAIIHTSAVVSGELLHPLNVNGSRHVALAATEAHARLIHLSSDVIFDGEHAPYDERASPQPITAYARSKAEAEQIVAESSRHPVIVRTSLIYGFQPMDPRTRDTLDGKMPRLFSDEFRCPIFVNDLADALLELIARKPVFSEKPGFSVLNLAGPQKLSRYEFGLKLARAFGVDPKFEPAPSESHPTPRPRDVTLDISLAQTVLQTRLRSVDEVILEWKAMNN